MMTPTTMTTSMVTTATTMMTDVVVVPSLGRLLVGWVLLTGTVPVGVTVPTVWRGVVVGRGVVSSGVDAIERKHITWHHGAIDKNVTCNCA